MIKSFKFKKEYDEYIKSVLAEYGYASEEEAYQALGDADDLSASLCDERLCIDNVYYQYKDEADEQACQINRLNRDRQAEIQAVYDELEYGEELSAYEERQIAAINEKYDSLIESLNNTNVDSSDEEPTCGALNNSVYFNSNDWELSAPKTYVYKGSNSLYPTIISADDFNLNSLLDMCMDSNFTSDDRAFYIRSEPTSDRKNGASKSFMFLKDGSAVYCVDSVTKKMRELSMSAAGGKDGIVSRPYYYISFPLAGKSRQLPLHKILAVFAHAEELIAVRNKLGVPLCGLVPNHKNNNGIDNDISNLEWVSHDENKLHSSAVELLAMADGGRFVYLVDKEHNTDVWVSAKDQWVIPNRNILNFKLSIKDIYKYLDRHHITIAGHSIRAIVNVHDFIKFLKSEGVIKEA